MQLFVIPANVETQRYSVLSGVILAFAGITRVQYGR